jgi:hypothetical protein
MPRADTHILVTASGTDTGLKEIMSLSATSTATGLVQLREGAAGGIFFEINVPTNGAAVPATAIAFPCPLVAQSGQTWQVVFTGTCRVLVNGQPG